MGEAPRTRVFVTGMGAVSAAGLGIDELWNAALTGRSGVRPADLPREGPNRVKIAAQVSGFRPEEFIEAKLLPYCGRFTQFAIVATDQAVRQAGLSGQCALGNRAGVIVGTGAGGITTVEELCFTDFVLKGRIDPMAVPRVMVSAPAAHIGIRYGCTGPTFVVSSACASGAQAIGMGLQLIRDGAIDRAIAGGTESTITPLNIRAWETLRVLTPDCTRPFSIGRNGTVLGEGAAFFVLESEAAACSRGAMPLAEIAGYGTSSDALDMVRPDSDGAVAAMSEAIADAGLGPEDIGYVNAHGTGTIANDISEAEALGRVFGAGSRRLPVSSTKPIHGHTLGAAGAIELAITIMALRSQIAPPTINWLGPDPKVELDPIPHQARALPIHAALSNSFAFGGINACLVVTAPQ